MDTLEAIETQKTHSSYRKLTYTKCLVCKYLLIYWKVLVDTLETQRTNFSYMRLNYAKWLVYKY